MTTEITTSFSVEGLSREQALELVREFETVAMLRTGQRIGLHSVISSFVMCDRCGNRFQPADIIRAPGRSGCYDCMTKHGNDE